MRKVKQADTMLTELKEMREAISLILVKIEAKTNA